MFSNSKAIVLLLSKRKKFTKQLIKNIEIIEKDFNNNSNNKDKRLLVFKDIKIVKPDFFYKNRNKYEA